MLVVPRQRGRSDEECGRVAFVAGKRLGNAVWRNAAKRRMRAICREVGGPWDGFDVVFLAKSGITSAPYGKVLDASLKAVSRSPLCDAAPREDEHCFPK